ncbi:MAG: right-handed parallel beta-helix repeat-containing protein [Candidatus Thorarchaeota archaeon]
MRPLKTATLVVALALLLSITCMTLVGPFGSTTAPAETESKVGPPRHTEYISQDPMYIDSNDDFATLGWSGDGSAENPYTLDQATFTDGLPSDTYIYINGTTAHFVIKNCAFHAEYPGCVGVHLGYVVNGKIIDSEFNTSSIAVETISSSSVLLQNLECHNSLIVIDQSTDVTVASCSILYGHGDGIRVARSHQVTVQDSLVKYSAGNGMYVYFSHNTTIINNNIRDSGTRSLTISMGSSLNIIYSNIFNEDGPPVLDDGYNNMWDDGVSKGNWYSDYDGSGNYTIPGKAGSIDCFPDGPLTMTVTTSTTSTNTNNSTWNGTIPITERPIVMVNISTFTPLDPLTRVVYAIWVGLLLGGAAIVMAIASVKKGGLLKFIRRKTDW